MVKITWISFTIKTSDIFLNVFGGMFTKHNKPNEYELGRISHKGSFHKVSGRSLDRGHRYRIGGAAESTGSADSALELGLFTKWRRDHQINGI
jgi:hypothetical protein